MVFFRISYDIFNASFKSINNDQELDRDKYNQFYLDVKAAAPTEPSIAENIVFNDGAKTIEISKFYGEDLKAYAPKFNKALGDGIFNTCKIWPPGATTGSKALAAVATAPEVEQRKDDILDSARDGLRDLEYKEVPDDTPDLRDDQSDAENLSAVLASNPVGLCLGGGHGDLDRGKMVEDLLDMPDYGGVGMFFIEEIHVKDQPLVDEFITSAPDTPMPAPLLARTSVFKDVVALLEKVRDINDTIDEDSDKLKIYGINDSETKSREGILGLENRVAMMNELALKVIEKAQKDNPGKKLVTYVGAAHSNTHVGGIPGMSQLLGIPALKVGSGTLSVDEEKPGLRHMPTKEELAFVQKQADKLKKDGVSLGQDEGLEKAHEFILQAKFETIKGALLHPDQELRGQISDIEKNLAIARQSDPKDPVLIKKLVDRVDELAVELAEARDDARKKVQDYIKKNPEILKLKDGSDRSLLHYAAIQNNGEIIGDILSVDKSMVDVQDSNGNTPLHMCLEKRDFASETLRETQRDVQATGVTALLEAGCSTDLQNKNGSTPLHLASLTGNAKAADDLMWYGADTSIEDDRGWTAYDVCIASTKSDVEAVFYEREEASPEFDMPDDPASVVDILMKATASEKAELLPEIRKKYERMYNDPLLRPILEMAAVDAMQPRDPPNEGGIRIFAADAPNTGRMYAAPTWQTGGQGAYDEKANVFLMSGKPDQDPMEGTLIHEMTHMVTRKMFGEDTVPYGSPDELLKYQDAIVKDVKQMNMMSLSDPIEERIRDRICGRMDTYAKRGGDLQLLQEFIVSIPQLIAEYGSDVVARYAPNLMAFFGTFAKACTDKLGSDEYKGLHGKIDNTVLDQKLSDDPPDMPTAPQTWLDPSGKDLELDNIMAKIRTELATRHGEAKLPDGVTFAYDPSVYDFKDDEKDAFEEKLKVVRRGLEASLTEGALAKEIKGDRLRSLILESTALVEAYPVEALEEAARGQSSNWARDTRTEWVSHQIKTEKPVSPSELAEAILIRAEDKARNRLGSQDRTATVEINAKKHKALVSSLTKSLDKQLKKLGLVEAQKALPRLVEQISTSLVDDKRTGFYLKKKNEKSGDIDHISINKKKVRKAWVDALKAL